METDEQVIAKCREGYRESMLDFMPRELFERLLDLAERGAKIPDRATDEMHDAGESALTSYGANLYQIYRAMIATALATPEIKHDRP
jgi:hypothetical protein